MPIQLSPLRKDWTVCGEIVTSNLITGSSNHYISNSNTNRAPAADPVGQQSLQNLVNCDYIILSVYSPPFA